MDKQELEAYHKAAARSSKEFILHNQLKRKFQVTSYKRLLENFNMISSNYDGSDYMEQVEKIDKILKENFTLHELRSFYENFLSICEMSFLDYSRFLEREFEEIDDVTSKKNVEINNLKKSLDMISELYD